jgi:HNH endonuclease
MEIDNPFRILLYFTKVIVNEPDDCWPWVGGVDRKGYGHFRVAKGKTNKAHIFGFLLAGGNLKLGEHVDHICNNPLCQNPSHLRALDNRSNNARSQSPSAINGRKTHCIRGHPFDGDNLIVRKNGYRECLTCKMDRERHHYAKG